MSEIQSNMFQRVDSTRSRSITRLSDKGSKSVVPRGLTPISHSANETTEEKTDKTMTQGESLVQSNPGEQISRNRVSSLPIFVAQKRASTKFNANQNNNNLTKCKPAVIVTSNFQKRQLESQFNSKKQKYMTVRKELNEKQKLALDLYEDVNELREKVIASGMKDPGKIERIITQIKNDEGRFNESKMINSEGASGEELSLDYMTTTRTTTMATSVLTNDFIVTLEGKLKEIPNVCLEVCHEALAKRMEIISLMIECNEKYPAVFDPKITEGLQNQKKDNQELLLKLENVTDKQEAVINELFQKTSALWGEHENYRIHIRELETCREGLIGELKEKLGATIEDLDLEKATATQLKEKKNLAESQLQKARNKIRELEKYASGNEAKIQELQSVVKHLETQMKQKEANIEARTKDMNKSVKNSEILVAKTEKQRDSLESRVNELKKKIDSKEAEYNEKFKKLTKLYEETKSKFETEEDLKCQAEEKLKELNDRYLKLEEKSQQLCDLAKTTKDVVAKPVDGKHTENEIQLWNELQSMRSSFAAKEEELLQSQREKERIISVLREAADQESPGSVKDKFASELVTKTEELEAAIADKAQLEKSLKTALEKGDNFEKQLHDLQSKLHAQTKEGGKTGWGAHAIELQQQLSDLRTNLKDLNRHNEELEKSLSQKQLELEQRDRIMREQSKVLKVRDELIGLLKGQNNPNNGNGESRDLQNGDVDEQRQSDPETIGRLVNKQIVAKAEDLQTLYSTLESKQMQLMRLEKVVRQMEDDNDRSQRTRTKLEKEVAQLRLQIHEKNRENRYVRNIKSADINNQRPQTSPQIIINGDSQLNISNLSKTQFQNELILPKLPVIVPIRSRHSTSSAINSKPFDTGKSKILNTSNPPKDTPSAQKLKDIIRAVEIEKARGFPTVPKRFSRSIRRPGPTLKNSTKLREDLYNWLMHPAGMRNDNSETNNCKKEFVRHTRALLNGELSKSVASGKSLKNDFKLGAENRKGENLFHKNISEGSRESSSSSTSSSSSSASSLIRPDSTMRIKSNRD